MSENKSKEELLEEVRIRGLTTRMAIIVIISAITTTASVVGYALSIKSDIRDIRTEQASYQRYIEQVFKTYDARIEQGEKEREQLRQDVQHYHPVR